jgi:hypothetical protein
VVNTNAYAIRRMREENFSTPRRWKPTTVNEIYHYIAIWLYMGLHPEIERRAFWSLETHKLSQFMSLLRFKQLHRYLLLRDEQLSPRKEEECFTYKVEPVASFIRNNCQRNWSPGTHIAVDEAMIAFRGRSNHKVKLKNKPIDEGYKVWIVAQKGYIITWLWHSK